MTKGRRAPEMPRMASAFVSSGVAVPRASLQATLPNANTSDPTVSGSARTRALTSSGDSAWMMALESFSGGTKFSRLRRNHGLDQPTAGAGS